MPHYYESGLLTSDTLVKTGEGYVSSITIAYKGVAAGEFCTLIDGTDATGSDVAVFVFPAANGTFTKEWRGPGKRFGTGIYYNKGGTAGDVYTELTYR